jgi:TRAP-type C4-dicarboxylate transport system permease small subunit
VKKAVQYGGYLQRRASISAMDQLQGLDCILYFVFCIIYNLMSFLRYVVEDNSSSEEEDAGLCFVFFGGK